MPDLAARIDALPAGEAGRVLNAITTAQVNRGAAVSLSPDRALTDALASFVGAAPTDKAAEQDVAKAALLLLAEDSAQHAAIERFIEHPPAVSLTDPGTLAIGVAALEVLQSHIKFARYKDGKWSFKFEKKPMSDSLLKHLISKLGGWLGK